MWLLTALGALIRDVDANKTLRTDEEFKFACRAIIEEHPSLRLEEIAIAFDYIRMGKFGKLYERLKTAEILEALRRYEGEIAAEVMEQNIHNNQVQHKRVEMTQDVSDSIKEFLEYYEPKPLPKGKGIGTRVREQLDKYSPPEE